MLPPLRQELTLHTGPLDEQGAPTWLLHDPPADRFHRFGWIGFEILSRWELGSAAAVAASVNAETTLEIGTDEVEEVVEFLEHHHLLEGAGRAEGLARAHAAGRRHWSHKLLHNYLFFRIPLIRPQPLLDRVAPRLGWAFSTGFWWLVAAAALVGLYLVGRQWDAFVATFTAFGDWSGWAALLAAILFAKLLHESGHAVAAHRYGCRVPTMGIAFLVLWPVLYTDTGEAWKLASRRKRLVVGAAGVLTELALAAFATLAWSFLPEGPLRAAAFFLATTTWVMTLAVNLNPFMRFDGYFLLSDRLGVENLHERSFAMGRWWLRELLFGLGEAPPEPMPARRRRQLIALAVGTWLYRFFLFLGIALLVYALFFKLLGIVLMVVELAWFIGRPVAREVAHWWRTRGALRWNRHSLVTALLAGSGLAALFIPWSSTFEAPALWGAGRYQQLYAPSAARVVEMREVGASVGEGALTARLENPDLEHRIEQARRRVAALRWQLERQSLEGRLLEQGAVVERRLEEALGRLQADLDERARLHLAAPFAGRLAEVNEMARVGGWVAADEPLAYLVEEGSDRVEALVEESRLGRLVAGGAARFIPEALERPVIHCRVGAVDRDNLTELERPYLASTYGGAVAVRADADGRLVLEESLYRVQLEACDATGDAPAVVRGTAHLEARPESLVQRVYRSVAAVLVRESGF